MKTDAAKKVNIKISSQEAHENSSKNVRKTLGIIQHTAVDKENLIGRSRADKDIKLASEIIKQKIFSDKEVQTEAVVTAEDLTSEQPSADYWRKLAEKRGEDLESSFREIEKLKGDVEALQEENKICKAMLDESKALVEVLQEMLEEPSETENNAVTEAE